jgi:hypothetical protein
VLAEVRVADDFGAAREHCSRGRAVEAADEARRAEQLRVREDLGATGLLLRRDVDPTFDVGQNLAALTVDPEQARRAFEADRLEVPEDRVHELRVPVERAADRVADPDNSLRLSPAPQPGLAFR